MRRANFKKTVQEIGAKHVPIKCGKTPENYSSGSGRSRDEVGVFFGIAVLAETGAHFESDVITAFRPQSVHPLPLRPRSSSTARSQQRQQLVLPTLHTHLASRLQGSLGARNTCALYLSKS